MTEERIALLHSVFVANSVGVAATFVAWQQVKEAEAAFADGLLECRAQGYFLTEAGSAALASARGRFTRHGPPPASRR